MTDQSTGRAVSFGPFLFDFTQRLLLEGGKPLRLGSRGLDILMTLLERPGELVTGDELRARAWPNIFVEEGNLKVQVAALRKTLRDGHGSRYIATFPGRGYAFVAPAVLSAEGSPAAPRAVTASCPHNLPAQLTRLVGRADAVRKTAALLPQQGFLTIVGPGGIGKTSVALAVAEELMGHYEHGIWLIDLSSLGDPAFVPAALAAVLGLEVRTENPLPGLIAALSRKQLLLVLDNCEHVVEAAAALGIEVRRGASGVQILATSREPLRATGERVCRLSSLNSPPSSPSLSASEALGYPAVQLFMERAPASLSDFELCDVDAPFVAEICRKLDGNPLAIEFAASRVDTFGVRGIAAGLDDRLDLLKSGQRSPLSRHQTMTAVLDWSYNLLDDVEQTLLRRLAIFAGDFSFGAARAVGADATCPEGEIVDLVTELVSKSLIAADVGAAEPRFRLLETTRAYARKRLSESGNLELVARRHADYYNALFDQAETEAVIRPRNEWLMDYGREINDLRAAIDWAFSTSGDTTIGVALTANSIPMWANVSLPDECRKRVELALTNIEGAPRDARREMRLYSALGQSLLSTRGPVPESAAMSAEGLAIAEALQDSDYQVRGHWGLCAHRTWTNNYRGALESAQKLRDVAVNAGEADDLLIGNQALSLSAHLLGDQALARHHLEDKPPHSFRVVYRSDIVRFQYDTRLLGPMILGLVLWLQGLPDQAVRATQRAVEVARASDHALSLCDMLTEVAWPLLLAGEFTIAEHVIVEQAELAARFGFAFWESYARGLKGVLLIKTDFVDAGLPLLRAALDEIRSGMVWRYPALLGELAQAFVQTGRVAEGFAVVDEALELCDRTEERWGMPELLRIKGVLFQSQDTPNTDDAAHEHFLQARDLACQQGALSWELRAAMSLAKLWRDRGCYKEALEFITPIYDRFTEGFETPDLKAAKALIYDLREQHSRAPQSVIRHIYPRRGPANKV